MPFSGDGSGTLNDPYLVETLDQLNEVNSYYWEHFKQIADITLGVATTPICGSSNSLSGSYNGNGYLIKDGSMTSTLNSVAIFGILSGYICNVTLDNILISGGSYTTGNNYVAGIVGWTSNAFGIMNCTVNSNCSITATASGGVIYTGGIVGYFGQSSLGGIIHNCKNHATISGYNYTGGIVGRLYNGNKGVIDCRYCINTGGITSTASGYTGGIIGYSNYAVYETAPRTFIDQCINTGNVYGAIGNIGGITGGAAAYTYIYRCYALNATIGDTSSTCQRITGTSTGTLGCNYALDTMSGDTFNYKTADGRDGADITYANSRLWSSYSSNNFNPYPWAGVDGLPDYIVEDRRDVDLSNNVLSTVTSGLTAYPASYKKCIAVDDSNNVYVSFLKPTNPNIFSVYKYASGSWSNLNLPTALEAFSQGSTSYYPPTIYHYDGKIYVVFMEKTSRLLADTYLYFNIYNVATGTWVWASNSLKIDIDLDIHTGDLYCDMLVNNGDIHITYVYNNISTQWIMSSDEGSNWSSPIEIFNNTTDLGSLCIYNNTVWCVTSKYPNNYYIYERYYDGSWSSETSLFLHPYPGTSGYLVKLKNYVWNDVQYIGFMSTVNAGTYLYRKSSTDNNYIIYTFTNNKSVFYVDPYGVPISVYSDGYETYFNNCYNKRTPLYYSDSTTHPWLVMHIQETNSGYKLHVLQEDFKSPNYYLSYSCLNVSYATGLSFKIYNGSGWVSAPLKIYNGSSWNNVSVKRYSGSEWV